MINRGEKIVVGVSGGADSVCLLFLLCGYRKQAGNDLLAVHINHMIRGEEADRDEAFVKELCGRLNVPLISKRINVPLFSKENGLSEEEAGRTVRYQAFFEAAGDSPSKIAVAHNREDNAETVLLNLARGAGLRGASGMRPVTQHQGYTVIRPLLEISRTEIEGWLKEEGTTWCEDSTNEGEAYSRNTIRHKVLPELERINSRAASHICGTASQLSEIEEYLEKETEKAFEEAASFRDGEVLLFREQLLALDPVIQKRVIYRAIVHAAGRKKDISSGNVEAVRNLLFLQSGRSADLPCGLFALRRYEEIVLSAAKEAEKKEPVVFRKEDAGETEKTVSLPDGSRLIFRKIAVNNGNRAELMEKNIYTKAFDYDKILGVIKVGEKVPGDVIELKTGRKTLKKLFIDEKIPADQRNKIPVLRDEKSVIWAVGSRISERHKITENTKTALTVEIDKGERRRED